ncbi:hypothetical protein [Enterococcus innesii]|uniref:hypothetical protein n=1 Tax=Enterococcus innesii TaxID=2839759 RepID=UPI0034A596D0
MTEQYFTEKEALEQVIYALESWYIGDYCDLHGEVFGIGYYLVDTAEAIEALEQYGTFKAIQEIIDYEKWNFGEVMTDVSDPCKVAQRLWYLKGYEALGSAEFTCILEEAAEDLELDYDLWNGEATEKVNAYIVNKLNQFITEKI